MSEASNYVPGVCNINPMEIRKRRQAGHVGLALTIIFALLALTLHMSLYLRLIVVLPAFVAAIGYLQARNKFCVGYASSKQQHADNGEVVAITDKDALNLDRKKTRTMNLQAFLIAAVVAIIVAAIPL